ncbi:head maturation protease, ClpP-related [Pontibacillus salipaludis]|uniref:ATP-dependent Clp protease proteolytic subunit n=1 Tax=Pontibacillus salipaludis TaxID=1697394 RepID=A0ABQ1PWQ9_9BACI|nr:head maturation protease, ClpP-related [Pontibacillus salipaludis]GGD05364.1 hypothetical protein GCM10011389_11090 [Pontibacillus salipaludis]
MDLTDIRNFWNIRPSSKIQNVSNEDENSKTIYIYGAIGGMFSNNSSESVRRQLNQTNAETIHVRINSGGGSVFEGVAICNLLRSHQAKIIGYIDGLAGSAASIVAMGCDELNMPSNTMMMVHQATTIEMGTADAFRKTAGALDKINKAVTNSYTKRFVGSEGELKELIDDETWLNADEAKSFGFIDNITDEIDIEETIDSEEEGAQNNGQGSKDYKTQLLTKYAASSQTPPKPEGNQQEPPTENKVNAVDMFTMFMNSFNNKEEQRNDL